MNGAGAPYRTLPRSRIVTRMNTTNIESTPTLWTLDPVHTTVGFSVRHLMITNVHGVFEKVTGTVRYDPDHPSAAQIEVVIPTESVHTREPQRDAHLRSADFLDAAAHPTMTFRSTRVRRSDAGPLEIIGDLTIRGTTREITLAVSEITRERPDFQLHGHLAVLGDTENVVHEIDRAQPLDHGAEER